MTTSASFRTLALAAAFLASGGVCSQGMPEHDHGVPEKLGRVSFPISCAPAVQQPFNRGVALLHSFAYAAARDAFKSVIASDPQCAMGHWGLAMTSFHPVWSPALPPELFASAQAELAAATRLPPPSPREQAYLRALAALFRVDPALKPAQRTLDYETAMAGVARDNPGDVEAQVFHAVALLANASMADKTHARQKQAIAILEPLFNHYPDHPGISHYLIHACDSAELAQHGLAAARKYAGIAPSAPHALHMPSHIFTRLGLWDDSIRSNLASAQAARRHGDSMGELHAMDYLVYAYLQIGRVDDARKVADQLRQMHDLDMGDFAVAYAATAMPVRVDIEQSRWAQASMRALPAADTPPSVMAMAVWARGIGFARSGRPAEAKTQVTRLTALEGQLRAAGDEYWAVQTAILSGEVNAWVAQAQGDPTTATRLLTEAADREDSLEKRPVTPGPVLPAREQLGQLLLVQGQPARALVAFNDALAQAPGRAVAIHGATEARKALASAGGAG